MRFLLTLDQLTGALVKVPGTVIVSIYRANLGDAPDTVA